MAKTLEVSLDAHFEVLFDTCGPARAGDVVVGRSVASDDKALSYLISVGAVRLTDKKVSAATPKAMDAAIAAATAALQDQLDTANVAISGLEGANKGLQDQAAELQSSAKIDAAKIAALKDAITKLGGDPESVRFVVDDELKDE